MTAPAPHDLSPTRSSRPALLLAAIATLTVVAVRVAAPWDILDNDQLRPLSYVLDIVRNGNWLVQHDGSGDVASKPPLYAWIAAVAAMVTGRVGQFELAVPSALGVIVGGLAVAIAGARVFGTRAACIAALAFVLTPLMLKQSALARTDALFAGLTTSAALLAFRAFERRTGWWEFWLVAALATLTKGPLTLLLATAGLLFIARQRPPGPTATRREWPEHLLGLALFLALTAGWFVAAWLHDGQPFIDKVLGRELFGHVVGASKEHLDESSFIEKVGLWIVGLFKPTLYLLARALPWSIPGAIALVAVYRSPAPDPLERRFERFLAGWLLIGLAVFSVVPHQRADLLSPIWAPGALLAGRWIAGRTASWPARRLRVAAVVTILIAATGAFLQFHIAARHSDSYRRLTEIRQTLAEAEREGVPPAMIMPADGSYLLTALCDTAWPRVDLAEAARLLSSESAAFVSTRSPEDLLADLRSMRRPGFVLARSDEIAIVSNRQTVSPHDSFAAMLDGLFIETAGCRLGPARMGTLIVDRPPGASAVLSIRNRSETPRTIRWRDTHGSAGVVDLAPFQETIITLRPVAAP